MPNSTILNLMKAVSMNGKKFLKKIKRFDEYYTKWKWRERKVSYGEKNADKTFFVIRRATCKVGLFSYVMTNIGMIDVAIQKGYIPVIDMQNNRNTYLMDDEVGKCNAWEFFFKQPCGYSLKDVQDSKNVILSNGIIEKSFKYPDIDLVIKEEVYKYWKNIADKYLHLSDNLVYKLEREKQRLFGSDKARVVGVLCRGTDYINNHPKGHPVQPSVDEIISKTKEVWKKHQCQYVYLATEDKKIFDIFKKEFGEKLKAVQVERYEDTGNSNINDIIYADEREKKKKGEEYLVTIALLAQCTCLVAGCAGGTYGALLLSEGYEYKYIFNKGFYV